MSRTKVLALAMAVVLSGCSGETERAQETTPPPPPETRAPEPPTTSTPDKPAPAAPLAFPAGAGAFVWHETDLDPELFARTLLGSGFDWAVLRVHDGLVEDPIDPGWLDRYRRAGGPPLGGWGVLRERPEDEAALASRLLSAHGLAFYVANAEAEYSYSGDGGPSRERYRRSGRFVQAFRSVAGNVPAGLSSYCRADRHDLSWRTWRDAGFHFLPQAYVNTHGPDVSPESCVQSAAAFFAPSAVHPTIGSYPGQYAVTPDDYVRMLARAGSDGFSVYLAETGMTDDAWRTLGAAAG